MAKSTSLKDGDSTGKTAAGQPGGDADPGTFVEEVEITIDHAIVQHFSQHLYSSPHKAVEELVVNGYDAGAGEVHVFLPGEFASDAVVVWDDGHSMDQAGLHQLWWVARSPKNAPGGRKHKDRDVIGKFGIGKLATYALGDRVAHLAHKDGRYLLVEFDFGDLRLPEDGQPPPSAARPEQQHASAPMRELDEGEARTWMASRFTGGVLPEQAQRMFGKNEWTAAVVNSLKPLKPPMYAGILRRVLGNGLPNRPNFVMFVDGIAATQVLPQKQPVADLTGADKPLKDQLLSDWKMALDDGTVEGDLVIDDATGTLTVPALGHVDVQLRIYPDSLLKESSAELGRSYGIFVMVLGRLLNEDDYQHLVQEPSFGTLYRIQIVISADGLDRALLADRERLAGTRPETVALRLVEQSAYRSARQLVDKAQAKAAIDRLTSSLLPTNHRELWHDPISAYSAAHGQQQRLPVADDDGEVLERKAAGTDGPIARYDSDAGRFEVNTDHPFRRNVDERIGQGKKAVQLRRVLDVYAVAEVLLEGHLVDSGVDRDKIAAALDWRNDLFREVARRFHEAPDELQARVKEASYKGDKIFEFALRDLFVDMGFDARRVAGPSKEDVLVVAPVGTEHHVFTVDAKGSETTVGNVTAHVGGVASHRDAADAEHAMIIARDFTGFGNGDEAAVLGECRAVGRVSVVTLDVLFALHDLMRTYFYPLRVVLELLRPVKTPAGFLEDLKAFRRPRDGFDFPELLGRIWEQQKTSAAGERVFYQSIRQADPAWKSALDPTEMDRQMLMLEWAAGGLIRVDSQSKTVTMKQHPDLVFEAVTATLRGEGYVHESDDD